MLHIKSFVFSPIQENTYILYNEEKKCAIIDPGCYSDEEKDRLYNFIYENNLEPVALILTHAHLDHIFGLASVAEKYKLQPQMHKGEKMVLDYAPTSGLMYNLPFINYTGQITYINEGDEIKIGKDTLKVLFTPGHSPAHLSYYHAVGSFVISGDALFQGSIGRTDLPGSNHDLLIKSIKEQLLTLPEETKVYSGHGSVTSIGVEKRSNPFLN